MAGVMPGGRPGIPPGGPDLCGPPCFGPALAFVCPVSTAARALVDFGMAFVPWTTLVPLAAFVPLAMFVPLVAFVPVDTFVPLARLVPIVAFDPLVSFCADLA